MVDPVALIPAELSATSFHGTSLYFQPYLENPYMSNFYEMTIRIY